MGGVIKPRCNSAETCFNGRVGLGSEMVTRRAAFANKSAGAPAEAGEQMSLWLTRAAAAAQGDLHAPK